MLVIPEKWTAIAYERSGEWEPYVDAPMSLADAKHLHFEGYALMAQRRKKQDVISIGMPPMELVIKKAKEKRNG
jgi:hypothetical protein